MCGIFGWQIQPNGITNAQRLVLSVMLATQNDDRGGDSYGFYVHDTNKALAERIIKGLGLAGPACRVMASRPMMMGHTRKATTGDVVAANSHPFIIGKIVGAHNGMVFNHAEMQTKYGRKCEVDSEHIFHHINEGLDVSELDGYGAIEYINTDAPDSVYLCKMSSGELAIYGIGTSSKDVKGIVWSSSQKHLVYSLETAGLEFFPYGVKTGKRYLVQSGRLFESTLPNIDFGESQRTFRGWDHWGHADYGEYGYGNGNWSSTKDDGKKDSKSATKDDSIPVKPEDEPEFVKLWQERLTQPNGWPEMPEWDAMTPNQKGLLVKVIAKVEAELGLRGINYHDASSGQKKTGTEG